MRPLVAVALDLETMRNSWGVKGRADLVQRFCP